MLARLNSAPLHIKLLGAFALVLAIAAAQSSFLYLTALEHRVSDLRVDNTQAVLVLASEAQTALFEMEADSRGFLLSGDETLLEQYHARAQTYTADLASLEQLTVDDPAQVARWRELQRRLTTWQAEQVDLVVAMRRAADAGAGPSAQELLAVAQQSLATEGIADMHRIFGEALNAEQDVLNVRVHANESLNDRVMSILVGGTLMVLGAGTVVAILFASSLARAVGQVRAGSDNLRGSERRYRQMFENNEAIKLLVDPTATGTIVEANAAACAFYGYSREALLGLRGSDIDTLPPDEVAVVVRQIALRQRSHFETTARLANGNVRDVEVYASPVDDTDRGTLLYCIVHDITERKQAAEALRHQASHDALTDLPNRIELRNRLQEAILSAEHEGTSLALLLLDLDRFKEINDTFGHHYGDRLLQQIGPRLRSVLRTSDAVARLGGDEFAVLLPGAEIGAATALAQQLFNVMNEPFALEEHRLQVGASIGIVASPVHGNDAETLLRRADVAMYVAKSTHQGLAVYDSGQDHHSAERLALVGELRHAIDEDQLVLQYQPKVDLNGRLVGVEALVRWQHPNRGMVPPDTFIGLAEHTGLIKSLTRWVLDAALRQCRYWLDVGQRIPVAVNVSTQDLQDETFPDVVARLLAMRQVPADCLRVEITEGAIMSEPARAMEVLTALRELGVGLSVDDFGTGYSSLAYLKRLPVDELKIDRSFIRDLATDDDDAAIVRSTIGLGHELGLRVIAEGVEDETTWRLLERFGCDLVQGYLVSRPLLARDLEQWLSQSTDLPKADVAAAAA